MLQPLEEGPQGLVYPTNASLAQLALTTSPQVRFRSEDVLRAYFLHGDPDAALPYQRALPHAERFVYLLKAVELFVLAHETAHVLLDHLTAEKTQIAPDEELAADDFALDVVTRYLESEYPQARTRAQLGGFLFHALNSMWEAVVVRSLKGEFVPGSDEHPPADQRFRTFAASLVEDADAGWASYVYSAIQFATATIPDTLMPNIEIEASQFGGLSARIAPRGSSHLLRMTGVDPWSHWMDTIMRLLDTGGTDRLVGLWFVQESPMIGVSLYEGLGDDDDTRRDACARALVAIEPMYANYLPRLRQQLRTAEESDNLGMYQLEIGTWLTAKARADLGERRVAWGPSHPDFYV